MRPITHTISMDEARARVLEAAQPITRVERVPLEAASGRVLAQVVTAADDVPPFDRAAMDGFAVLAADTAGASRNAPRGLECIDAVYTGRMPSHAIRTGECIRIATGAPMPEGADAVVMVEETEIDAERGVRVLAEVRPGQNVGRRGGDLSAGEAVLQPGAFLTPARVGAAAAAGLPALDVYARPAVAIASTGNELVEAGTPLGPGQIHDVNRHTLAAVVRMHGGEPLVLPTAPDTLDELIAALERAAGADLVVLSGGSSVGDRDLVLDAIRAAGEVVFHGISVKPGKPTLLGRLRSRPVLGMPGNPTSCLTNAYLLLVPLLRRTARLPELRPQTVRAPLARRIVSRAGRHQFYTVRLENGAAVPAFKASSDITSMSTADGYIEIPADIDVVETGELVEVTLF